MSKIKLQMFLDSNGEKHEKKLLGTKRGNHIYFVDDKVKVTIEFGDIITMRRRSLDYEIFLKFKENETLDGIYNLIKENYNLPIDIKTNKMYIDSGQFVVDYEIRTENVEMGKFVFELKYEVIE